MSNNRTSRRSFISRCAAIVPAVWAAPALMAMAADNATTSTAAAGATAGTGPFKLPPLGYAYDALEPHVDAKTMTIHHDKHHAGYVAKLNKAVEGHSDLTKKSVDELLKDLAAIPESIRTDVRNNGGGHSNHSMFWQIMKPGGPKAPSGDLADAINSSFESMEKFQQQFEDAGAKRFGSGWVWLVKGDDDKLKIVSTANQDSPISDGMKIVMGNDVWEHAYYLKYQNKRGDYLKAWWNVLNWDEVAARFAK
ncbi:superoxide dismutase [candidate division BRC1 bacterium HGW-BRC1-1]|nr:MAG: superoxide dismutase [candidate division BRC1 bacterium HGW-BRC1-1]